MKIKKIFETNMLSSMCFIHWALNYEGFYFVDKYYLPANKRENQSEDGIKFKLKNLNYRN